MSWQAGHSLPLENTNIIVFANISAFLTGTAAKITSLIEGQQQNQQIGLLLMSDKLSVKEVKLWSLELCY